MNKLDCVKMLIERIEQEQSKEKEYKRVCDKLAKIPYDTDGESEEYIEAMNDYFKVEKPDRNKIKVCIELIKESMQELEDKYKED